MLPKKLVVLLAVAVLACGKRGDPFPPVPIIPKATTDLLVAQRGPKVLLSWGYPSLTTAGKSMTGIKRVVVWRAVEESPAATPSTAETPIQLFAKVPALIPVKFLKVRTRVDSIEGSKLPAATAGARLTYDDTPPLHTANGRPVRLTYAVVTEGQSANSDLSNLVSIVPM